MRLPFRSPKREPDRAVEQALDRLTERIDRLLATMTRTNELLERLEAAGSPWQPSASASVPKQLMHETTRGPSPAPRASAPSRRRAGAPSSRLLRRDEPRPAAVGPRRLHEAITLVLREAGEPLTANDIAARIRDRNLFAAPRSGHELSGSQVSARVGNAHYRSRFVRRDGRIWLADPEAE